MINTDSRNNTMPIYNVIHYVNKFHRVNPDLDGPGVFFFLIFLLVLCMMFGWKKKVLKSQTSNLIEI